MTMTIKEYINRYNPPYTFFTEDYKMIINISLVRNPAILDMIQRGIIVYSHTEWAEEDGEFDWDIFIER